MEMISNAMSEFWDMLTGVLDDKKAKLVRLVCFGLLFLGIIYASMSYFNADRIADTNIESDFVSRSMPRVEDTKELTTFASLVRKIEEMKHGSEAVAEAIVMMNTKPFNVEGGMLLDAIETGEIQVQEPPEIPAPQIAVKAIISSANSNVAIINAGGKNGLIVKRGDKLPNDLGRIVRIKSDGITVRHENKNFDFEVVKNIPNVEGIK